MGLRTQGAERALEAALKPVVDFFAIGPRKRRGPTKGAEKATKPTNEPAKAANEPAKATDEPAKATT